MFGEDAEGLGKGIPKKYEMPELGPLSSLSLGMLDPMFNGALIRNKLQSSLDILEVSMGAPLFYGGN